MAPTAATPTGSTSTATTGVRGPSARAPPPPSRWSPPTAGPSARRRAWSIASLATVECQSPVDVLWAGAAVGDSRSGACTSSNDVDEGVADDAVRVDVLGTDRLDRRRSAGRRGARSDHRDLQRLPDRHRGRRVVAGRDHGLPLRLVIDARLRGGSSATTRPRTCACPRSSPAT